MQPIVIAPSILSADFARLGEEVEQVLAAGDLLIKLLRDDFVHFEVL